MVQNIVYPIFVGGCARRKFSFSGEVIAKYSYMQ